MMSERYCWDDGKIIRLEDVRIAPYDLGFMRGFSVFDVMRVHDGRLVFGRSHFERFVQSARALGMNVPMVLSEFEETAQKLLQKNELDDAVVRMVLTGGVSDDVFTFTPSKERLMILVEPFLALAPEIYTDGGAVTVVDYQRELSHVKYANYMEAIRAQSQKVAQNAVEILYVHDDIVSEASTSNVFIIKDGVVVTPNTGVLMGVTRKYVIEIAQKNGIIVEERTVTRAELLAADEVFLTATNKAVVPIVRVDEYTIGTGAVGTTTGVLMKLFQEFIAAQ